jgi:nucleotide-binding universal stress UspA family protein
MAARPLRIVVGYDGSEAAARALDAAADLVGYGSTLAVVTVSNGTSAAALRDEARDRLHRRSVDARYHELVGEPGEEMVKQAEELDADLLVVGSASAAVAREAPCDVLVVR